MRIFSIEGNIGSGKSTFLKKLEFYYAKNNNFIFLQEPVDNWNEIVDSNGVNILTKYYADQSRYAFSFQMMAFITRLKQISETIKKYKNKDVTIFTERCIFTDREIFARMLYDEGKIEDVEYMIYLKWFDYFVKDIKINGIIYIKTYPSVCMRRIQKRNREGEDISVDYLINLHNYHQDWLILKDDNTLFLDGTLSFEELIDKVDEYVSEPYYMDDSDDSSEQSPEYSENKIKNILLYVFIPVCNAIIISLPFIYLHFK